MTSDCYQNPESWENIFLSSKRGKLPVVFQWRISFNEVEQLLQLLFIVIMWMWKFTMEHDTSLSHILVTFCICTPNPWLVVELLISTENSLPDSSVHQNDNNNYDHQHEQEHHPSVALSSTTCRTWMRKELLQEEEQSTDTLLVTPCGDWWCVALLLSKTHSIISVTISAMRIMCHLICNWSRDGFALRCIQGGSNN